MKPRVFVIGAGAAGFFAAISAAETFPDAAVIILERTDKVLAKVRISGGGRCNVTHACFEPHQLVKFYPRGNRWLKKPFKAFDAKDTVNWFTNRGVSLKIEDDGRMFPVSDSSETIIDCLLYQAKKFNVQLKLKYGIDRILPQEDGTFLLLGKHDEVVEADKVIIASGGFPKRTGYDWLRERNIEVVDPVPSLFTFNIPAFDLVPLSGISLPDVKIRIVGTKLETTGPLLITHWGFSGPAVLKLSAWGARALNQMDYRFKIHISWVATHTEDSLRALFEEQKVQHPKRGISGNQLFFIPQRLWKKLVANAGIGEDTRWIDASKKDLNKLIENLFRAEYQVHGKTTFKEEFVTCGGVELADVNAETMESKKHPGLFFAGEIMDVDGVTGGFNFQNAWTTGYIAGKNVLK